MNFKIIKTKETYPDVLLHRDYSNEGNELVRIMAIGTVDNDEDMMVTEDVTFETSALPAKFITDFSQQSAERWCGEQGISF